MTAEPTASEPTESEPTVDDTGALAPGPGCARAGPAETPPATSLREALTRLEGVHARPTHEQADLYQSVHTELQNALGTIDDA